MLKLLYYNIDVALKGQIEHFVTNSALKAVHFYTTDDLAVLTDYYLTETVDLIVIHPQHDKEDFIALLRTGVQKRCKIILFSLEKNDVFDFLNYNIFGFLFAPVESVVLLTVLNRCLNAIALEHDQQQLQTAQVAQDPYQKYIPINSITKIELIKIEDISHFEADGRYTVVHLNSGVSKMASKNLGEFQKLLNPAVFCRIHHKFIINMNHLLNIIKSDGYYCEMSNSKNVPVSKRKLDNLNVILNLGKAAV
jgi:two-component system LytT family response regulator